MGARLRYHTRRRGTHYVGRRPRNQNLVGRLFPLLTRSGRQLPEHWPAGGGAGKPHGIRRAAKPEREEDGRRHSSVGAGLSYRKFVIK